MNKILASARIALRALKVNRMRSALTMLGIIIGVAAVIAMVGVGAGATTRIQQQIQSIGSNLIIVLPGSISTNGVRLGSGAVVTLTDLQDGKKTATYTGQSGSYQFSELQVTRDYEVQATFKGVSSRVRRISTIDPRNRIVLNLRIPPPKEEE